MQSLQLRQREYLLRISRAMTARLDRESLLRLILNSAVEMVGGQVGLIALQQEDGRLAPQAVYGLSSKGLAQLAPLLADFPDVSELRANGWRLPELSLPLLSATVGVPLRQVVNLPLRIEDELVGVIYVFRTGGAAFGANERQVLQSFADQAAIAVRNVRLYQQVTAEKKRLDTIIENSADGVMILGPDRRIQVINRALATMTGWSAADAVGRPCWMVLTLSSTSHGPDPCATDGSVDDLPRPDEETGTAASLYVEGDLERPGGSRLTLGVTYTPLYNQDGDLLNVIVNVVDITRFREAEQLKSTFVSVISHELKTPVALIKGYASTLGRPDAAWDPETLRDGLAVIEEEADRLNGLINNLLDASRIQAGVFKLELTDVDLARLAQKVVDGFSLQTDRHRFELDFPPNLPPVLADEARLRQVLDNLVSNAIKYSPEGGTIRLGAWHDGLAPTSAPQDGRPQPVAAGPDNAMVTVYVADQGIGIPVEGQERLFESFYRVDSGLRRQTKGTGLGLFLSKAIVEAHGGQIWVRSEPGKGSTFFFSMPQPVIADRKQLEFKPHPSLDVRSESPRS